MTLLDISATNLPLNSFFVHWLWENSAFVSPAVGVDSQVGLKSLQEGWVVGWWMSQGVLVLVTHPD